MVADTDAGFFDRPAQFIGLYDLVPRLDLLFYTPGGWQEFLQQRTGFWASVHAFRVRLL